MGSMPTVAVLSSARWSGMWLSKQRVSEALARLGHTVLYVDPPLSPLSVLRQPARRADLRAAVDERAAEDLAVWRPRVVPAQNSRWGQAVNARLLAGGVHRRLGPVDLTVAFSLEARGAFGRLGGRRVYYCTDSAEDLPGVDRAVVRDREQRLIDHADVVVACSKPLVTQLRERGVEAAYLPHGCAPEDFAPLSATPWSPPELVGCPRPWVGMAGSINFRVDAALLDAAHDAARDGTLVVIGGRFAARERSELRLLLDRPGVVAVGHVDRARLAAYVAALDVGLVPYTTSAFNRKSFPLKVLQYLAAGVPVVSTPNGATDEIGAGDDVRVASDAGAFHDEVAALLRIVDDDLDGVRRRQEIAAARPWSAVARALLAAAGAES